MSIPPGSVQITTHLSDSERADVEALVEAAAEVDGVRALDERATLLLTTPEATSHLLVSDTAGTVVGYAHLDPPEEGAGPDGAPAASADLVVHPAHRGQGIGRALLDRVLAETGPVAVHLWAHGPHPAAARLAAATGCTAIRSLWWMHRPLTGPDAAPLPDAAPPSGVTIRTFVPGRDDERWLAVNAAAFAAHPEQGRWTRPDLDARLGAGWFDADGFFVAERAGDLVGFHWTKIHTGYVRGGEPGPMGEIYVLGVAPGAQGGGLATALAVTGLTYLRDRGLRSVMLYVEADNPAAVGLYRKLGFTRAAVDVMYGHYGQS